MVQGDAMVVTCNAVLFRYAISGGCSGVRCSGLGVRRFPNRESPIPNPCIVRAGCLSGLRGSFYFQRSPLVALSSSGVAHHPAHDLAPPRRRRHPLASAAAQGAHRLRQPKPVYSVRAAIPSALPQPEKHQPVYPLPRQALRCIPSLDGRGKRGGWHILSPPPRLPRQGGGANTGSPPSRGKN